MAVNQPLFPHTTVLLYNYNSCYMLIITSVGLTVQIMCNYISVFNQHAHMVRLTNKAPARLINSPADNCPLLPTQLRDQKTDNIMCEFYSQVRDKHHSHI